MISYWVPAQLILNQSVVNDRLTYVLGTIKTGNLLHVFPLLFGSGQQAKLGVCQLY